MLKKTHLLLALILCATGCTREVYLQSVPCVECEESCPCIGSLDCCEETVTKTNTYVFEIEDVPATPTTYKPCAQKRNCRTVCRQVEVTK